MVSWSLIRTARQVTCSRLEMRFVPHDEESNSWGLEEEPKQLAKDIWSRKQIEAWLLKGFKRVVQVRRDLPTPHQEEVAQ